MVAVSAFLDGRELTAEHHPISVWTKLAVETECVIQTESVNVKKGSKEKLVKKVS